MKIVRISRKTSWNYENVEMEAILNDGDNIIECTMELEAKVQESVNIIKKAKEVKDRLLEEKNKTEIPF